MSAANPPRVVHDLVCAIAIDERSTGLLAPSRDFVVAVEADLRTAPCCLDRRVQPRDTQLRGHVPDAVVVREAVVVEQIGAQPQFVHQGGRDRARVGEHELVDLGGGPQVTELEVLPARQPLVAPAQPPEPLRGIAFAEIDARRELVPVQRIRGVADIVPRGIRSANHGVRHVGLGIELEHLDEWLLEPSLRDPAVREWVSRSARGVIPDRVWIVDWEEIGIGEVATTHGGIGHGGAADTLNALSKRLVVGHEEHLVLHHRTCHGEPELIAPEGILVPRPEPRSCLDRVVAQEFEDRAVEFVRPSSRRDIDLSGGLAELGRVDTGLDLELLQGVNRRTHDERIEVRIGVLDAVQREAVVLLPLAAH